MMGENKSTEWKREYIDDIKNTVIAFANTDGGIIYIGINDEGTVCGVKEPDDIMLRVNHAIRDSIRPDVTLFTNCSVETMDGEQVVVISVQRGTARPYYLTGKAICPEGVFVRQGSSTVPATETAISNMIKETSGDCYESARSLNQQLTFNKTEAYFKKKGEDFGENQKSTLNLIGSDGTYTNLALLLSDQCNHTIKLGVFGGGKKSVFRDRRELSGSLINQLEEAYEIIDRYNRNRTVSEGLDGAEMRDYPPEAVREALLNAVVHRDYAFNAPILISVYDDRIKIVTIGGLVRGISMEDIQSGISALRNRNLANVFFCLKLFEAYGSGILKIKECYKLYSTKPLIEVSDNAFKITLPNTNYEVESALDQTEARETKFPEESRISKVKKLFDQKEFITRKDIENELNTSQASAILILRRWVDIGILVKEGTGRKTYYRLGFKIN